MIGLSHALNGLSLPPVSSLVILVSCWGGSFVSVFGGSNDVKVHLAMAPITVMLNIRADALRAAYSGITTWETTTGKQSSPLPVTNWYYSCPIDTACHYSRGSFMAAMFYYFLDPVFGAMMKQACRQTLKSLAAEYLVGVRLGC